MLLYVNIIYVVYMLYIYYIYIYICVCKMKIYNHIQLYTYVSKHIQSQRITMTEGQNQGYIEATYPGHILQQELSQLGDVAS